MDSISWQTNTQWLRMLQSAPMVSWRHAGFLAEVSVAEKNSAVFCFREFRWCFLFSLHPKSHLQFSLRLLNASLDRKQHKIFASSLESHGEQTRLSKPTPKWSQKDSQTGTQYRLLGFFNDEEMRCRPRFLEPRRQWAGERQSDGVDFRWDWQATMRPGRQMSKSRWSWRAHRSRQTGWQGSKLWGKKHNEHQN